MLLLLEIEIRQNKFSFSIFAFVWNLLGAIILVGYVAKPRTCIFIYFCIHPFGARSDGDRLLNQENMHKKQQQENGGEV